MAPAAGLADRSFELCRDEPRLCRRARWARARRGPPPHPRLCASASTTSARVANRRRVEESFADRLHELRSTVVAIEGGVATWSPEIDAGAESTLRAALIAEIRRLRALMNESQSAVAVEAFDVEATLAPTIAVQRANGQQVTFSSDGTRRALGRPAECAQVVHGLLINAAKYAPGSPVHVRIEHAPDEIAIRVEDEGPGIDPVYWDEVFERGVRLDGAVADGSGLGLTVARRIIRSQDGDLWLTEGRFGGAAFVISIPAAPALRVVASRADTSPVMSLPIQEAR